MKHVGTLGTVAVVAATLVVGPRTVGATDLRTLTIDGVGTAATDAIEVFFNPKEYTVTKSTPWKHHDVESHDAPSLEFEAGEPYRLRVDLFFDTYESGTSVREVTDKVDALLGTQGKAPPDVVVGWGGSDWTTHLLDAKTQVVDVAPDGTPLAAVVTTLWSAFVEVGQQAVEPVLVPVVISTPKGDVSAWFDASSIKLLTLKKNDVVKGQPIRLHAVQGFSPKVDFTEGDPERLCMDVVVESPNGVRSLLEAIAALARVDPDTQQPPTALFDWGPFQLRGIVEAVTTRFTMFDPEGVPVRATTELKLKEASQLRIGRRE